MELNAFLNLLLDGLLRPTIRWIESLIAAKRTASRADFPISIGAAEARVDADFLHPSAELLREVVAVAVESSIVAPRVNHDILFLSQSPQNQQNLSLHCGKAANRRLSCGHPVGWAATLFAIKFCIVLQVL